MVLIATACGGASGDASQRVYRLTSRDALALRLPDGWQDAVRPLPGEPFPSVFLAPAGEGEGGIVLTVMGRTEAGATGLSPEELRRSVEESALEMTTPSISEVSGDEVRGWLATETAAGEPPDSYGIVVVGQLMLTVTVQGGAPMRDHALAILRTGRHEQAG
jgi:hypothetical protein